MPPVATLNDRVRERLKSEKARRKLSEREIGSMLQWSQSKVAQKFNGRTPITLDEFEGLCFVLSIAPTEAVRDRGLEFCAELTPTELRVLERLRQLPPTIFEAVLTIIDVRTTTRSESRRASTHKKL